MPKNPEALIRNRIINRFLNDYRYESLEKIKECCELAMDKAGGISERTIRADLR